LIHRRCDLKELEQMLANCPNCSRWSPGDGPLMAVIVSARNPDEENTDTWSKFGTRFDLVQIPPPLSQPKSLPQFVLHNWK
jgi:hypothetical protein